MPLRSPSGICWASANGSPEAIQEFVVRESSRNPHCQLVRPSSAATSSPFSHTCLYCLPFPARHSGKAQCQRRALASTSLAGAHLLKTVYRMAQHLRLARERRCFSGRGKSAGCVLLLTHWLQRAFVSSLRGKSIFQKLFRTTVGSSLFLLYCFISIAWSDFPFMAFKRWTKIFGHPIMALIVLTEPDPEEALTRLMKRCAYVVVPVSILWIKYYPQLGTGLRRVGRDAMNKGIAVGKNMLGADCLILGFFFFWHLLQTWRTERNTQRRNELRLIAGFLIGILWLLRQAHSATSTISLFVAILIVVFVGIRSTNKNFIGTYMLAALVLLAAAELAFGISGHLSESFG